MEEGLRELDCRRPREIHRPHVAAPDTSLPARGRDWRVSSPFGGDWTRTRFPLLALASGAIVISIAVGLARLAGTFYQSDRPESCPEKARVDAIRSAMQNALIVDRGDVDRLNHGVVEGDADSLSVVFMQIAAPAAAHRYQAPRAEAFARRAHVFLISGPAVHVRPGTPYSASTISMKPVDTRCRTVQSSSMPPTNARATMTNVRRFGLIPAHFLLADALPAGCYCRTPVGATPICRVHNVICQLKTAAWRPVT